ncbi:hypothetical protein L798_00047 [Zootermopsis nevadensis]|uniref:Uncharacterized protein n=1 Tax=Zootermopsis nevadensis TaxID=136037 RepID=A0A067QRD5_ZOONE|nr:hypothetical protein L798_00047 [Zootermopsis nevadensis]
MDFNYDLFYASSHITALLKKLSPRPRHKAALPNSSCPWVVVEFSKKDLESPDAAGRANSFCSDHSFDMAVHATRLRGEEAAKNESTQGQVYTHLYCSWISQCVYV